MKFDWFWSMYYNTKKINFYLYNINMYWLVLINFYFQYILTLYKMYLYPWFIKFKSNNYAEAAWFTYTNKKLSLFKRTGKF